MQISNPFQMNDWGIKKFFVVVLAGQLALWGTIGLDFIGFQIPIIRQFVAIINLTFILGLIILRVLKLHKLGNIETLLYAVGLSIAILMFIGFLINMAYPPLGISKPMSLMSLMITISAVMLILCVLSYMRDKEFSDPSFIELRDILLPPVLFLCIIPFLAVFGTYMVNFYQTNIILMFMIIVISLTVILIGFNKFIPTKLYPLAVFIIAISLLFHNALISMYIWGWDIHIEYYIANLVITDSLWNSTTYSNVNGMLSIVILPPIFSVISGMNLTWIFKIIYPLLFSLVPLGLYRMYQKQTNDKIAFLSVFFFMSLFTFYTEMLALARQQIAELFLVLLLLSLFDKNLNAFGRSILAIIFAFSISISHYGLSYIFLVSLIAVFFLLYLTMQYQSNRTMNTIRTSFVFLYVVFTLSWYMSISSSSTFNSIVHIGTNIANNIFIDYSNPATAQGLDIISRKTISKLHDITKYIHLLFQFFIGLGILTVLFNRSKMKFEKEYVAFSYVYFLILLAGIIVPFFASSLNTTRLYQISLIFLAPFCMIGIITIFRILSARDRTSRTNKIYNRSTGLFSILLSLFLLANSGFIYEIANDYPTSISISQENIKEYGNGNTKMSFYNIIIPEQDAYSAKWLSSNMNKNYKIYADDTVTGIKSNVLVSAGLIDNTNIFILTNTTLELSTNSYVFLRYVNVIENIMNYKIPNTEIKKSGLYNTSEINHILYNESLIYSNGGSNIYI